MKAIDRFAFEPEKHSAKHFVIVNQWLSWWKAIGWLCCVRTTFFTNCTKIDALCVCVSVSAECQDLCTLPFRPTEKIKSCRIRYRTTEYHYHLQHTFRFHFSGHAAMVLGSMRMFTFSRYILIALYSSALDPAKATAKKSTVRGHFSFVRFFSFNHKLFRFFAYTWLPNNEKRKSNFY